MTFDACQFPYWRGRGWVKISTDCKSALAEGLAQRLPSLGGVGGGLLSIKN